MRIGQVSQKYRVPINNIYFYINYGLIVPPKPGGQYVFDDNTLADLELLLELKEMDFPLKDIHRILSLFRVSHMADQQDIDDLKQLYRRQMQTLQQRKQQLDKATVNLAQKIARLDSRRTQPETKRGMPLSMLTLLCCPHCGGNLEMSQVRMNQQYIFFGELNCHCGYQAVIDDGILVTSNRNTSLYDKPDVARELYKDLPPKLISLFQVSYNWMTERLNRIGLEDKVMLESYVNAWFFLHNHQHILPPNCRLIIIDKFTETLRNYKNLIERQKYGADILYIADSGVKLPLKYKSIDINVDFFATNEHNFYHHSFWLDHLRPYLKDNAHAIGTYFYFENGQKSMNLLMKEYPEAYKLNFSQNFFLRSISKQYQMIESEDVGFTKDSGDNLGFSFHVKGEEMHLLPYLAKTNQP